MGDVIFHGVVGGQMFGVGFDHLVFEFLPGDASGFQHIPTAQDLQTINGVLFKVVDGDRFLGVVGVERQVAQVVVGGGGIGQFAAFAASGGQGRRRRDAFGGDRNHGGGVFWRPKVENF